MQSINLASFPTIKILISYTIVFLRSGKQKLNIFMKISATRIKENGTKLA
jgi:hypothetical protein